MRSLADQDKCFVIFAKGGDQLLPELLGFSKFEKIPAYSREPKSFPALLCLSIPRSTVSAVIGRDGGKS